MRIKLSLAFVCLLCMAFTGVNSDKSDEECFIVGDSRLDFIRMYQETVDNPKFNYPNLTRYILSQFEGLPYGTGGRGCPSDKTLVNFNSFDCVTMVETFWATTYTIYEYKARKTKRSDPFLQFAKNLDRIRYFGGQNCGNNERMHYFTQAMQEMQKDGLVFNVATGNGDMFWKKIDYLSKKEGETYSDDYLDKVTSLEKLMSDYPNYYFPKEKIWHYLPMAKTGDIIALASVEPGLDVSHTGIITVVDGEVLLSHASSLYDKVVFEQGLMDYLNIRTKVSGVFVYRPIFH